MKTTTVTRTLLDVAISAVLTTAVILNGAMIGGLAESADATGPSPECGNPTTGPG